MSNISTTELQKLYKSSYVVISNHRCSAIKKTQDKTRVTLISTIAVHYTMLSNSLIKFLIFTF